MDDTKNQNGFLSLDVLAITLGLPRTYLRSLADKNEIPYLEVGGRRRFDASQVREKLTRMAEKRTLR